MKKLLALSLSAITALTLASCNKGPQGGTDVPTPDFQVSENFDKETPVKISFWHTMSKTKGQPILDAVIEQFNKDYPNVTVENLQIGGYDEVKDQVITNLGAKDWPTMAYCYPDHVASYNEAKITLPLDSLMDDPKYGFGGSELTVTVKKEDIHERFLLEGKEAFQDKKTYTLPFLKSTEVFYYNKDFFAQHNLEVPKTWDEVWALCAKIKQIDPLSTPLGIDSEGNLFISLAEQYGYKYTAAVEDPEGRFLFDNPEMKALMKTFRENYKKGHFITKITNGGGYTNKNFTDTLATNRVYMTIGSTGGATYQAQPNNAFETGIAMYPQASLSNIKVMSQGPNLCFFQKDNKQETLAAWIFAQYLLKAENQIAFATKQGYIPVTKSATDAQAFQDYLANAAGNQEGIAALAGKQAIDQLDYYFTSPVFVGSADARKQVESLVGTILQGDDGGNLDKFINSKFAEAIEECLYQVS